MLTAEEKRDWVLENCVDEDGDINLQNLDFSEFDGDVMTSNMKVKKSLFQYNHKVVGDLHQGDHKVGGDLHQDSHKVDGDLYQGDQNVSVDLYQSGHRVDGDLFQSYHEVNGSLCQRGQNVGDNLYQTNNKFGNALFVDKLDEYDIAEMENGELEVTNKAKQMTMKELEEALGYKIEIVEELL